MNLKIIPVSMLLIFAVIGFMFSMVLVHELVHKTDLKGTVTNGTICLMELSDSKTLKEFFLSGAGSYSSIITNQEEYIIKRNHTEARAYSSTFVLLVIFLLSLYVTVRNIDWYTLINN